MYQTSFVANRVDEKEIQTLADWIAKKTGASVTVEQVIVVSTDSVEVSAMLDSLRDSLKNGKATKGRKGNREKPSGKGAKAPKMGPRFLRIESTGEILSKQKLNKKLAAGEIENLTNVYDAKGQLWVVIDGTLTKGPQE